jgi:DnaK suppressor protein
VKKQAHTDTELNQVQLKELMKLLLNKRREIANMFDTLNQQIVTTDDCSISDAAEAASRQESRARASAIVDHNRQIIVEIDAALERLMSGRYGVSEATGKPIAYERLVLIPWARTGADE